MVMVKQANNTTRCAASVKFMSSCLSHDPEVLPQERRPYDKESKQGRCAPGVKTKPRRAWAKATDRQVEEYQRKKETETDLRNREICITLGEDSVLPR